MKWDSRALAIQIKGLDFLAQRAKEASKSLQAKNEVLTSAYQNCLKQNINNDSILHSLSHVETLQNSILLTNLLSGLILKFIEILSNIFNMGNIQDLSLIEKSETKDLQDLVDNTFIASNYLGRTQPQHTLSSIIYFAQHLLNMNIITMKRKGLNEEASELKSIITLRDTLSKLFEIDALESLFKQMANSWRRLLKEVKPILITKLKDNLGADFLKWTKALGAVLFDLTSRISINHNQTFIDIFAATEKDSDPEYKLLDDAKAKSDDHSSSADKFYQASGFGNNPSEIQTMREEVNATGGDLDKLIELFERKKAPNP